MQNNTPITELIAKYEPKFQVHLITDEVVSMIKHGSYKAKFDVYASTISKSEMNGSTQAYHPRGCQNKLEVGYFWQKELFKKELIVSDVWMLNRVVVPKKYTLIGYMMHVEKKQIDIVIWI